MIIQTFKIACNIFISTLKNLICGKVSMYKVSVCINIQTHTCEQTNASKGMCSIFYLNNLVCKVGRVIAYQPVSQKYGLLTKI